DRDGEDRRHEELTAGAGVPAEHRRLSWPAGLGAAVRGMSERVWQCSVSEEMMSENMIGVAGVDPYLQPSRSRSAQCRSRYIMPGGAFSTPCSTRGVCWAPEPEACPLLRGVVLDEPR